MIRILVFIVIITLALILFRSFRQGQTIQRPIDVEPVDFTDDDDIIDVDPVEEDGRTAR